MAANTFIIRADASVEMGTGHVMRCLALAEAWQDRGGNVIFAMAQSTGALRAYLSSEHVEVANLAVTPGSEQDAIQLTQLACERAAKWVVVDGYQFNSAYQRALKQTSLKVLWVDDTGESGPYTADVVLNQNISAHEEMYMDRDSNISLLLGTRYVMLRREFKPWRDWTRQGPGEGLKILVTMGGSDVRNVTEKVIRALGTVKISCKSKVVVGGSNPHGEALKRAVGRSSAGIELLQDPQNMAELMAWADAAITAAGSTCWEICLLGLPAILIDLAPNQLPIARELNRRRCAVHLGSAEEVTEDGIAAKLEWLLSSPETRRTFSRNARELVDGRGAERVLSAIMDPTIHLRPAEENDCRLLWEWANDPEVRAASFSPALIAWDEHVAWFSRKQNDPDCRILVGVDVHSRPVGQFRVESRPDGEGQIDVSLSPGCRGLGYGRCLIELGSRKVFSETAIERLHAFVKPENSISRRAFGRTGFTSLGEEDVNGCNAVHYVRTRDKSQSEP
ncbi:MAG: UDP-2,4-diacetamido-2,4,6-trideoxy-beta-L-altropyranose hydrolase [Terriglobales bacterium]